MASRGGVSTFVGVDGFGTYPVQLDFYLESHAGPLWEIKNLRHMQGWLVAAQCNLETLVGSHASVIVAACTDEGTPLSRWLTDRLIQLDCSLPRECHFNPPQELEWQTDMLYWDFLGSCDLASLQMLETAEQETGSSICARETRLEDLAARSGETISILAGRRRNPELAPDERKAISDHIGRIEYKLGQLETWVIEQIRGDREKLARFEKEVFESLTMHGEMEPLYIVHWRTRTGRRPPEIKWPLQQEERRNPGIDLNSEEVQRADVAMREAQQTIRKKRLDALKEAEKLERQRVEKARKSKNLDLQLEMAVETALQEFLQKPKTI